MTTEIWPSAADLGLPANMVRTHKAADIGPYRDLAQVTWDIGHNTQGGFAGSEIELTSADGKIASCHAMVGTDGFMVLMVPLNYTAWTPGNDYYARRSINLEIVGFDYTGFTDAQYRSYAAYHRWAVAKGCPIANTYIGKKGLGSGILGHQDVPNPYVPGGYGGASGHTDPGPLFKWDLLVKYIGGETAVFDPNPKKFDVGPGMLGRAAAEQMTFITNEQYFSPNANQPGLGQMSRAWVQDSAGVTYIYMASEQPEFAKPDEAAPWKVEKYWLTA
jgi:hypothetical protein